VVSRSGSRTVADDSADAQLLKAAEEQAAERTQVLAAVNADADKRAAVIEENQWVLPLSGYRLSATFGQTSYLWSTVHTGLDFAAPSGTQVRAVANGTVTSAGYDGSYGNKVVLTLEDGTEIWYCHLSAFHVSVGERVTSGGDLGAVGSTGNSTGSHLHLEVRPGGGDPINPYTSLLEHGVQP
jgi:murein DD-endopeptidase MepM/ murein hydrolase activator NlpD